MSEKYRLIKYNENLAEIGNDRSIGLLFLVDEDCERKLRIIVDLLNEQQDTINDLNGELEESSAFIIEQRKEIQTLKEDNEQLKKEYKIAIDEMLTDYKKLEKEKEVEYE